MSCPARIYHNARNAIVDIVSFPNPTLPFNPGPSRGCGFFIVTAGHLVIEIPVVERSSPPFLIPVCTGCPLRKSRIFVRIYNVNGGGKSFVYEVALVGVDGAGDIAVLKIDLTHN